MYRSVISEHRQADRPPVGAGIVLIIDREQSSNGMRERERERDHCVYVVRDAHSCPF